MQLKLNSFFDAFKSIKAQSSTDYILHAHLKVIFLGYYLYIVIFLFCHFILKMFAFEFECSTAGTIIILNSTKR